VTRAPLVDLPYWPRFLSRDEAARYLGVSTDVFDDEVRAGDWPRGWARGSRGGRLTWDRLSLDRAADARSGLALCAPGTGLPSSVDAAAAAMDRRFDALPPIKRAR
jgi:hypothetical protein